MLSGELTERDRLEQIFGIKVKTANQKRVGMFFKEPVTAEKFYTPRVNPCANLLGNLFNNQKWTIFDIPKGEVPTVEELCTFDGILLTGSSYSVLSKSP